MREVEIGGQKFDVRSLKRKEVKELIGAGMNPSSLPVEKADECMDKVFSYVFTKDQNKQIDELDQKDAMALFAHVLKETYGAKDEEKNLLTSGDGEQTKSE